MSNDTFQQVEAQPVLATPAAPTAIPQPIPVEQPVPAKPPVEQSVARSPQELRIYSHSALVYWWPVWAMGYLMAGISYWQGETTTLGEGNVLFHPSGNLGVIFLLTLFCIILITNIPVRGLASGMVVMGIVLITVLFAYFGWWDTILTWLGNLRIYLNVGAYFWFSTLMLMVWVTSTFVFDRMSYWLVTPGQLTHEFVLGAGSKSYDTNGMLLEKHREDLFRHWLLGLGSGDLQIQTTGATRDRIDIPNVMFVGSKIEAMQRLIAIEPGAPHEA